MDLRQHTRAYCAKDNRLAALSYFGTFAVYFLSLYLAIAHVLTAWYVLLPAGDRITPFQLFASTCCNTTAATIRCSKPARKTSLRAMACRPLPLLPFEVMKQNHNLHHSNGIGNLDHRETGEIHTMTLARMERGRVPGSACSTASIATPLCLCLWARCGVHLFHPLPLAQEHASVSAPDRR